MSAVFPKFSVGIKKFLNADIRRNAINFSVAQRRGMTSQHADGNFFLREIGVTKFKSEIKSCVLVEIYFALFDELHNGKDGKHFGK